MWTYFEICSACVWQLVPISLFTGSKNTQVQNPTAYRNIREHAENFSTPSGVSDVLAMSCLQLESKYIFNIPMVALITEQGQALHIPYAKTANIF